MILLPSVAKRNSSACERAGYIFNGPEDCEALIRSVGADAKVCTKWLDPYSLLTLSQDPYVTYESGIKVHANANKTNFDGVAESCVKLSGQVCGFSVVCSSLWSKVGLFFCLCSCV